MTIRRRPERVVPPEVRFSKFISPEPMSGCLLWLGGCDSDGYGIFRVSTDKQARAHRFAYERARGPVPEELELDHLCRVRSCVNPAHLEAVTGRENTLRGLAITAHHALKTHCVRGHPLYGPNLFRRSDGARGCRLCSYDLRPKKTNRRTRARLALEAWVRSEVA